MNAAPDLGSLMEPIARDLTGTEPTSTSRDELRFRGRGSLAVCIAGPKRGAEFPPPPVRAVPLELRSGGVHG